MRYVLGLALLLLPATAFAQMFEGPGGSIPVTRCDRTPAGVVCSKVVDGAGLTSDQGFVRADRGWIATNAVPAGG
jgi:hypothetical protein